MSDSAFRTKVKPAEPEEMPKGKTPDRSADEGEKEEVPYLDYGAEHNHPHLVDFYKLGDNWDDPTGGFPEEVEIIESYIKDRIGKGELLNERKEVEKCLKKMEKVAGVSEESRKIVKIEALARYVEFLMDTDDIKFNVERYGYH